MVYVAMIGEGRIEREKILKNVSLYFNEKMGNTALIMTLVHLINKGLARSIRPDDEDATEEQKRERIFLYDLLEA